LPSSVKISGNPKVIVQGGLRVSPEAEEVNLAADLLAPPAVVVGGQRK